eukprot:Blabericola_migrator_1__3208@NODE_1944_length_3529_cov_107_922299_g1242_i0_p2_GENE_NODE_1944_length_3529_cov_107_922299_g1242_i0NODE_1944_length_3529_cov_107_922299_g1242_i0_p2_ORF_typecomplete_len339_score60_48CDC37_N/PF03234_14/0_00018CDC37_N/PF03234_14/3e03CDC37_N/PF03234_14/2_9e03CS/PF04969_16/0_25CS/PF04969_16/9_8e03_NODE_1944_length_3529_cov_107_922299_g1242_i023743390
MPWGFWHSSAIQSPALESPVKLLTRQLSPCKQEEEKFLFRIGCKKMPPIDYSRWDHLDVSSDEEGKQPRVTTYDRPMTVSFGGGIEGDVTEVVAAKESITQSTTQAAAQSVTQAAEKSQSVTQSPPNGAVYESYCWHQTQSHVIFWFPLSAGCVIDRRRGDRKVELVMERPPDDVLGDNKIPEALIASDFNEAPEDGDLGLFPVAWGLRMQWPCDHPLTHTPLWQVHGDDKLVTDTLWFRYPVMAGESTWNWTLETKCPYMPNAPRFIKVELSKKKSMSLHNVSVTWNKGLLSETSGVKITRSEAEQARHDAFMKVWQQAHQDFKDKVKSMQPTELQF